MPTEKVLIVDDQEDVRMLLSRVVDRIELVPLTASSAMEANKLIEEEGPSVVLLDLEMPGYGGAYVLNFLRQYETARAIQSPTSVIVISGYISQDVKEKLSPLGVSAYIPKPFNIHHIGKAIQKCISPPAQMA